MSAVRERGGHRAPFRLARAIVLGAIVASLSLSSCGLAVAANPLTATTPAEGEVQVEMRAAPSASGVVRAGDTIRVRVTLTNTSAVATEPVEIALKVAGSRAVDANELAAWFAGSGDSGSLPTVALATVSPLDPGASAILDLAVEPNDAPVSGDFGARLAAVTATMGGERLAEERTAVVWAPSASTPDPAAITFVAAISTPQESSAFLSASVLARYTAPSGSLTRALDAVAGRPVLLAIDPRVIASIRVLGADAPASAITFLERLELAPNESFLLPWADADPLATITAAGSVMPAPEGIGQPGAGAEDPAGTPTDEPTPPPSAASALTIDELSAWPTALSRWQWTEPGSLTADAVPLVEESGVEVLITADVTAAPAAPVQRIGAVRFLAVDSTLALAARDASTATSQQQFDRALARVSALLSAHATARDGAQVLIPLSRSELAGTPRMLDTIAQAISLPWARPGLASTALAADAPAGTVRDTQISESRARVVTAALEAEASDRRFAQIALTPTVITDVRRLELLAALSLGWGDASEQALQGFVAQSRTLQSSIQVVESSGITLLTDRVSIPVTVQNDLDVAVRVYVRVEPNSGQLRVLQPNVEAVLEPRSQSRALVPVESLTNGQVTVTVSVRDADLTVLGTPTRVTLNLQAGWETAGIIIAALVIAALFIVGITRDIRKRRRRVEGSE